VRIAISGKSGCGNTTVSSLVSKELGYPLINFTFRNLAEERHMEFWDLAALAEKDDSIDFELDRRQVEMALAQKDCILASRLAIWMLKEADLKIYLDATVEERARRIHKREGGTLEEKIAETTARDAKDTARYKRLYDIDNTDSTVADILIDTTRKSAAEVAHIIVHEVRSREKG
jgi:cytidylate kinase